MAQTVLDVLEATVHNYGDYPAMRVKGNGRWQTISWRAYRDQAMEVARGLIRLGLEPRQGVVILARNSPQWFLTAIGTIAAGGVPAGIYTTSPPEQCRYITAHADAVIAVVQDTAALQTFLGFRSELSKLKSIVLLEGAAADDRVCSWETLLELGRQLSEAALRRRVDAQRSGDVCSLIYTSGTTGLPKAVMISHQNIVWSAQSCARAYRAAAGEEFISYLPLSHIAEQLFSLHIPMAVGACTSFAESMDRLGENLREVRPHFFLGVPRVWEKIQAAIQAAGAEASTLRKYIVRWARGVGLQAGYAEQQGGPGPRFRGLAERLVFAKVRERLGLDRARCCFTSAAPIARGTLEFFLSLGIPILEAYGLSECAGPTTLSYPKRYRIGKAGLPMPGTELRIAADGEILIRGPHVFLGYYKDPAATREALDEAAWLHSGDIGALDDEGFLTITDRKKDIIITSGGENIAPQAVEMRLREVPGVAHAVLVGDGRKYVSALLLLDADQVPAAAEGVGSPARLVAEAAVCPIFRHYLERQVEMVNRGLSRPATIKRFAVLSTALSVEGGELTPTLKLKRRVIYQKYAEQIERLCS